jgi:hypothetical protein
MASALFVTFPWRGEVDDAKHRREGMTDTLSPHPGRSAADPPPPGESGGSA